MHRITCIFLLSIVVLVAAGCNSPSAQGDTSEQVAEAPTTIPSPMPPTDPASVLATLDYEPNECAVGCIVYYERRDDRNDINVSFAELENGIWRYSFDVSGLWGNYDPIKEVLVLLYPPDVVDYIMGAPNMLGMVDSGTLEPVSIDGYTITVEKRGSHVLAMVAMEDGG